MEQRYGIDRPDRLTIAAYCIEAVILIVGVVVLAVVLWD
jgi:hypothetical protein